MIRIENMSIAGSLILRFGLPLDSSNYCAFSKWLKDNLDKREYQLSDNMFSGEQVNFNMFEQRELTKGEIEFLERIVPNELKEILNSITEEDFLILNLYFRENYAKRDTEYNKDNQTKEELKAIKALLELGEVELYQNNKGIICIKLTAKGRNRYFSRNQKEVIRTLKEKLETIGIDPSLVNNDYLTYISQTKERITDSSFNNYMELIGEIYPEDVSFIASPDYIKYDCLKGIGEKEKNTLELLLSSQDENTSICLVETDKLGISKEIVKGYQIIKWPKSNEKMSKITEGIQMYHSEIGERLLREIVGGLNYHNPKLIVEKKTTDAQTTYTIRGLISIDEFEERYLVIVNPTYTKQVKETKKIK